MKNLSIVLVTLIILLTNLQIQAQEIRNKGSLQVYKNEFYEEIKKASKEFFEKEKEPKKEFKVDFTELDLPKSKEEFTYFWHNDPVSQGNTGTCWSFSTTSFLESEIYRINKKKVKLSENHTVYWEYVEKARRFVRERGNSDFGQGSESNAVTRMWKEYGVVPSEVYTTKMPGQKFHDHSKLFDEMNSYLKSVQERNAWNEEEVLATIKSILNHYFGVPPTKFTYEGKEYTPKEFLSKAVNLNLDDYISIISLMQEPYYSKIIYDVPDNWWKDNSYYNVPLDEYMNLIKNAIRKGYTMSIGGDVSEAGINSHYKVAMVPTFDIPSDYIDENARQFRFSNGTTGDDHGLHLIGYMNKDGKDWYLIKDSGSGSFNVGDKGYYFYTEDYLKLKMIDFMVHKDAVGDLLKKFGE